MKQLALKIQFDEVITFDTFYTTAENRELVSAIKAFSMKSSEEQLFLIWGSAGVGKTHLCHAICHYAGEHGLRAGYLDLRLLRKFGEAVLEGSDQLDILCWDHLESLFPPHQTEPWAEHLFEAFNRLRDNNTKLLVSAERPPQAMAIGLPDLASRLNWGLKYQLKPLSHSDQCNALIFLAEQRGMFLSNQVAEFIVRRIQRRMQDLRVVINRLDEASLSEQRKLTIPFVKACLSW